MRSLLERLKQEGYRLFGLTNWCSKVHVTMKQYPIFELLEGRLVSSEEHLIKPERAIYERMCEKFALKPEECVFADDRMDNIEAARAYGREIADALEVADDSCHVVHVLAMAVWTFLEVALVDVSAVVADGVGDVEREVEIVDGIE